MQTRRTVNVFASAADVAVAVSLCLWAGVASGFEEAPVLTARVAEGKLPPVVERLPKSPLIVQPVEQTGKYGGTLRLILQGAGDLPWLERVLAGESLVRWDPSWTKIIPNLATSWTVNSNATEYVFKLRQGVRWSDGTLFSADDLVFWNEKIFRTGIARSQSTMQWLGADGQPVVVTKRDVATVVFRFTSPNGLLLFGLAGLQGDEPVSYPARHLGRFHPETNPEGIATLLQQHRITDWKELMRRQIGSGGAVNIRNRWLEPGLPRLTAWQLVTGFGFGRTNQVVAERNPFYWKVDVAGQQLPYLDRVVFTQMPERLQMLDAAVRGEIDFGERTLTGAQNMPGLKEGAERGGYHFNRIISDSGNLAAICLNLTHSNAAKRALYQNKNFRIGLSHAIDRERIIREVIKGPGKPRQVAPKQESPMYLDRLATQYTAHDLKLANEHLDRAGLTERDADGWRIMPNGARLSMAIQVATIHASRVAAMKIVKENWAEVGVFAEVVSEELPLLTALRLNNAHDVMVWAGDGGLDVIMDPRFYLPAGNESLFAVKWARWFATPKDPLAEEPPELVRRQMALYRSVQAEYDVKRQHALMLQLLELTADFFPVIGICTADEGSMLVKNNLRNVPKVMLSSGRSFPGPSPANPCQFYFDPPEAAKP